MAELVAGAALGAAVSELLATIIKAETLSMEFDAYFRSLKGTIESLILKIEEIRRLDEDKAAGDNENNFIAARQADMSELMLNLKKGMVLVTECSGIQKWQILKKYRYSKRLLKLQSELHRFSCLNIQADMWRDVKELVLRTMSIQEKVNKRNCTNDFAETIRDNENEAMEIPQNDHAAENILEEVNTLEIHECTEMMHKNDDEKFETSQYSQGTTQIVHEIPLIERHGTGAEIVEESAEILTEISIEDSSPVNAAEVLIKDRLNTDVRDTTYHLENMKVTISGNNDKDALRQQISALEYDLTQVCDQLQTKNSEFGEHEWVSKRCYMFSLPELKAATNDFNAGLLIGKGFFGTTVYKALLRCTTVAIKTFDTEQTQSSSWFSQKVVSLTNIRHPNLVKLIGVCPEAHCLVYELQPGGSLEDYLFHRSRMDQPLSWRDRSRIAAEICSALIFLHALKPSPVIHGNLKPTNVLLDAGLVVKLVDFGMHSLVLRPETTTETVAYMDPQFSSTKKLTEKSDVYAFGVIVLQLLTAKPSHDLVKQVQAAVAAEKLDTVMDSSAGNWPRDDALKLALLGLQCCERNARLRPNLRKSVWLILDKYL